MNFKREFSNFHPQYDKISSTQGIVHLDQSGAVAWSEWSMCSCSVGVSLVCMPSTLACRDNLRCAASPKRASKMFGDWSTSSVLITSQPRVLTAVESGS